MDPLIKSQLLYQLSYAPATRDPMKTASRRRVAKGRRAVQGTRDDLGPMGSHYEGYRLGNYGGRGEKLPCHGCGLETWTPDLLRSARKSDESCFRLANLDCRNSGTPEFRRAAPRPGNEESGSVAVEPAMLAPVHGHVVAAHRAHQEEQPVLLVLVEALVERAGRVGEAL